jgi:hypothetical protein
MKKLMMFAVSCVALAGFVVSPADAASKRKSTAAKQPAAQQQVNATPSSQGGVLKGPLYNGQDYLGDDPDPGIRAYLLKDMTRYQGSY